MKDMLDTEIDDNYKVEHDKNYSMTPEQLRKLIWQKFERNNMMLELRKREALLVESR